MPLSPQDVRGKVFRPTRLRRGYDEDEVDAFLDEVEAELGRLLNEIGELQRQLQGQGGVTSDRSPASAAGAPGGPELTKAAPCRPAAASRAGSGEGRHRPHRRGRRVAVRRAAAPEPSAAPARQQDTGTGLPDSEAEQLLRRTLVLAQRTAEQAIQEARLDAERLRGEAQHTYEEQIGRIEEDRRRLEGQVDQLRSFEREYRTRLRAYLEMQLRELDKAGAPQAGANAVPAAARQPLTPGTPGAPAAGAGPGTPVGRVRAAPMPPRASFRAPGNLRRRAPRRLRPPQPPRPQPPRPQPPRPQPPRPQPSDGPAAEPNPAPG